MGAVVAGGDELFEELSDIPLPQVGRDRAVSRVNRSKDLSVHSESSLRMEAVM